MRNGFTIVELLIVVVIIGIMLSIAWVLYGTSVENARRTETQVAIARLDREIGDIVDRVYSQNIKGLSTQFVRDYNAAGNPAPNTTLTIDVAEVVLRRDALRKALPQRLEDMWGLDGIPGTADDSRLWSFWKFSTGSTDADPRPTGHRHDLENSELLYLALSSPRLKVVGPVTELDLRHPARLNEGLIRDSNSNGIPEIVDSWGEPLRFYLWPTRFFRPGGNGTDIDGDLYQATVAPLLPAVSATPRIGEVLPNDSTTGDPAIIGHPLNNEPMDFTGVFADFHLNNGLLASPYDLQFPDGTSATYPPVDESTFCGVKTYSQTLLVSAGPGGELGLVEPNGFDPLTDTDPRTQGNPLSPLRNGEPVAYRDPSRLNEIHDNIGSGFLR